MPNIDSIHELNITSLNLDAQGTLTKQHPRRIRMFTEGLGDGLGLDLIEIPGGTFMMGSRVGTGYEYDDERPQHRVTIPSFWMGKCAVTQNQWQAIMGKHTSRFTGSQKPVDTLSWKEAAHFCERLAQRTGRAYRLPSEAEWEYACRAETTSAFHLGETITAEVANYNGEFTFQSGPKGLYRHVTTEVGMFAPNAFGLHDMHGNVWEWCADPWHDTYTGARDDEQVWKHKGQPHYRVARGGCWHDTPDVCRSAARLKMNESEGDEFMGMRVAVTFV